VNCRQCNEVERNDTFNAVQILAKRMASRRQLNIITYIIRLFYFWSIRAYSNVFYTVFQKTWCRIFATISSTVNQFWKFFHCWIQR